MRFRSLIRQYGVALACLLLFCIKQALTSKLPLYVITGAGYDDALLIEHAMELLEGNWLGKFSCYTLMKGVAYPLFLAICYRLSVSTVAALSALYGLGCGLFCYGVSPLFKRKWLILPLFAFLLFNPIALSSEGMQRVYRNGFSMVLALIVIGACIAIYTRRAERPWKLVLLGLTAGLALAFFYQSREDAMWLLPFPAAAFLLTALQMRKDVGSWREKGLYARILCALLPLLMLFSGIQATCMINKAHYGFYGTADMRRSDFTTMIGEMFSIAAAEGDNAPSQHVLVLADDLEKMYAASPSLNGIREDIQESFNEWSHAGQSLYPTAYEEYGAIPNGWFLWALRGGLINAGLYESQPKAEAFCAQVVTEFHEAIENGTLKSSGSANALLMPIMESERANLLPKLFSVIYEAVACRNVSPNFSPSDGLPASLRRVELLCNHYAVYPDTMSVSGILAVPSDGDDMQLYTIHADGALAREPLSLEAVDSAALPGDVFNGMRAYRFTMEGYSMNAQADALAVVDANGAILAEYNLSAPDKWTHADEYTLYIENADVVYGYNRELTRIEREMRYINKIIAVYQALLPAIGLVGGLCYILLSLRLLLKKRFPADESLFPVWLFASGILGVFFVYAFGIAFNSVTQYDSQNMGYMAGMYPVAAAFISLPIGKFADLLLGRILRKA